MGRGCLYVCVLKQCTFFMLVNFGFFRAFYLITTSWADMRLVRLRKSPYGFVMLTGSVIVFLFIIYVLSNWGGNERDRHEDVEKLLNHYMKSRSPQDLGQFEDRLRRLEYSFERQQRAQIQQARKGTPRHKLYPPVVFLTESDRKRILITGGAGFVGSHLVDTLLKEGHEVTVVDNFFTGRKRNVEHWIGHENFELLNHDVVNPLMIEVDQIYHLASPASPKHYMYNPIKTLKTNALGTLNLLGLAKRVKARLLLASTSEVYGDPEVHPQVESYWGHVNPIGPRACYDEGKRVAETMTYTYANQENVEVRVARIFNTFGPRMHFSDGRVVSNFIIQALQNKNLTLFGTGFQTRSFMYVSDLVDGLIKLMNSNVSSPVNLGNPEEHTIYEFAEMIKKEVGGTSTIVHLPPVEDDPRKRKPDIQKAWDYLRWKPVVPLKEGIRRTVEYFRKEIEVAKRTQNISEIHVEPIRI